MELSGTHRRHEESRLTSTRHTWRCQHFKKLHVRRKDTIELVVEHVAYDGDSGLRHTGRTWLALSGEHPKVVQTIMRHSQIRQTMDTYGHLFLARRWGGVPLTEYCDNARISLRERLNFFVPVRQAVQHAHQKAIIYRDLKPSNTLVCLYDGCPVPKVIDFGLAKAIHQSLTAHTLHTAHGLMLGTPLNTSPEQEEFNNTDVDTRADIHSLGVILGPQPQRRDSSSIFLRI